MALMLGHVWYLSQGLGTSARWCWMVTVLCHCLDVLCVHHLQHDALTIIHSVSRVADMKHTAGVLRITRYSSTAYIRVCVYVVCACYRSMLWHQLMLGLCHGYMLHRCLTEDSSIVLLFCVCVLQVERC